MEGVEEVPSEEMRHGIMAAKIAVGGQHDMGRSLCWQLRILW